MASGKLEFKRMSGEMGWSRSFVPLLFLVVMEPGRAAKASPTESLLVNSSLGKGCWSHLKWLLRLFPTFADTCWWPGLGLGLADPQIEQTQCVPSGTPKLTFCSR